MGAARRTARRHATRPIQGRGWGVTDRSRCVRAGNRRGDASPEEGSQPPYQDFDMASQELSSRPSAMWDGAHAAYPWRRQLIAGSATMARGCRSASSSRPARSVSPPARPSSAACCSAVAGVVRCWQSHHEPPRHWPWRWSRQRAQITRPVFPHSKRSWSTSLWPASNRARREDRIDRNDRVGRRAGGTNGAALDGDVAVITRVVERFHRGACGGPARTSRSPGG